MTRFIPLLAALMLGASPVVSAQAPKEAPKAERKADPAKREAFRQAREKARKACEGKAAEESRREMCAQSKEPAACDARAKEHAARRAQMREACKDKKGEELKACIREHRGKSGKK